MERPILNPMYAQDPDKLPESRRSLRQATALVWRWLKVVWRVMTYQPLKPRNYRFRAEEGGAMARFVRGLFYRVAFIPLLAALLAVALVFASTHPFTTPPMLDPSSRGVYFEAISLLSDDGVRLEGWLVPVVDARFVLAQKEQSLRTRRPAVVLLHDHGQSRQQMLPLIRPLHDAGYVVLAVAMRGRGGPSPAGATFGLRESVDAKAAVELLRRRSFVDGTRIALVGVGSGATAALIAATGDPNIFAVAAIDPVRNSQSLIAERIAPREPWLSWMRPLCKWTFELSYQVDVEEVELTRFTGLASSRPVLIDLQPADETMRQTTEAVLKFLLLKMPATTIVASAWE